MDNEVTLNFWGFLADNIGIIFQFFSVLSSLGVLFLGISQWKKAVNQDKAKFLEGLIMRTRTDDDIIYVMNLIDYNEKWYNVNFHGSDKLEKKVDKTLSHFSYICYLNKSQMIGEEEFSFFIRYVHRIIENEGARDYLYNIYHFSNESGTKSGFHYLIEYGRDNKLLNDAFFDKFDWTKKGTKYHHYLNF